MKMVSLYELNTDGTYRESENWILTIPIHSFIHSDVQELALEICRPFCQAPCFLIIGIEVAPPISFE
jgi:hypothetical protein